MTPRRHVRSDDGSADVRPSVTLIDGVLAVAILCLGVAVYQFLGTAWTWTYAALVLFVLACVLAGWPKSDEDGAP